MGTGLPWGLQDKGTRTAVALEILGPRDWPTTTFTLTILSAFSFFFSFYGCTNGIWKFPEQGSNWGVSWRLTPQPQQRQIQAASASYAADHGNAGSLTHWTRTGMEPASSQTLCWVLNLLSHNRNSVLSVFKGTDSKSSGRHGNHLTSFCCLESS